MALLAPPAQKSRFELVGRLDAVRQPYQRHVSGSLELVSIGSTFAMYKDTHRKPRFPG